MQGTPQSGGRLVAVGDVNGTVSLLEVCDSLAVPQSNEKGAISSMFEREFRREKNLEVRPGQGSGVWGRGRVGSGVGAR